MSFKITTVNGIDVRVWDKSFQIVDGPFVSPVIYVGLDRAHGLLGTVADVVTLYKDARKHQHAIDVAAQIPAPFGD